ncbi:MAG: pilus assembly protein PilP [Proteobacteria bacterium]|nr:pilus assembly protein PilP [Pseudomonadota bacterium]
MMRRHSVAGMVGGVLMLLLAGVTGAVVSWAGEAKAVPSASPGTKTVSPGAPAAKTISAAAPAAYVYNAAGKPDPFRPFIEMELALRKKKQEEQLKKESLKEAPVSPLQQADIWKFRLIGIAGDREKETASAIVEDGTKKRYYPLFVGTYIGLNGGRVAAILPDRVIVEEPAGVPPKKGQKAPLRRINMMLHRD